MVETLKMGIFFVSKKVPEADFELRKNSWVILVVWLVKTPWHCASIDDVWFMSSTVKVGRKSSFVGNDRCYRPPECIKGLIVCCVKFEWWLQSNMWPLNYWCCFIKWDIHVGCFISAACLFCSRWYAHSWMDIRCQHHFFKSKTKQLLWNIHSLLVAFHQQTPKITAFHPHIPFFGTWDYVTTRSQALGTKAKSECPGHQGMSRKAIQNFLGAKKGGPF